MGVVGLCALAMACSGDELSQREFDEEAVRLNFGSEPPELTPVFDLFVDQDGTVRWNGKVMEDDDLAQLRQAWRKVSVQPAVGVNFADEASYSTKIEVLQDMDRIFDCAREFACVLSNSEPIGE